MQPSTLFLLINGRNPIVAPGLFYADGGCPGLALQGPFYREAAFVLLPFIRITIIVSKHIMGNTQAGSIIHIAY